MQIGTGLGIGRLDPRAKIISALLLVLTISLLPPGSWRAYALLYALVLVLALSARLSLPWLWRRSLLALPFLFTALFLPFVVPGETLFILPGLGWPISRPGAVQAGSLILRTWIAVQVFILLMGMTSIRHFLWGLEALKLPPILVEIIAFAYRYLQVLGSEAQRMATARRARLTRSTGAGAPFNFHLRSLGGFFGSLLLRGLERSERVYSAMLARGYDGVTRSIEYFHWSISDSIAVIATLLLMVGLLVLSEVMG